MYEYSWIQYMARLCGSTAYNFSKGGLSTRTFLTSDKYEMLLNNDYACQAYFIALGHNDINQKVPVGTVDDINLSFPENNNDTFCGNYGKIISKLKEIHPNCKIFIITMKDERGENLGYNEAIRNIANVFSENVYLLDIQKYVKDTPNYHFTEGHGNTMGYLQYAYEVSSYVDYIIRKNPTDFKYVQFINTEYEEYIVN